MVGYIMRVKKQQQRIGCDPIFCYSINKGWRIGHSVQNIAS